VVLALVAAPGWAVDVERLSPADQQLLQTVLEQLEPLIADRRREGTAAVVGWEEVYEPLTPSQRSFLDAVRELEASSLGATSHSFGEPASPPELVPVGPQAIRREGISTPLDLQYLPREVLSAYQRMMEAMEAALGKRLLVESGYRSPAYQLYLFLFYLPQHGYAIRETNRYVALPGHSEHGYPPRQAIDFINEEGVNGEDDPEAFEALAEYQWLVRHAGDFGFALSYPRDNPDQTAFEPWHWHATAEERGAAGRR
jgi:D-alanyl-D-alanine carboxypeptidase